MAIAISIDRKGDSTVFNASGEVSFDEVKATIEKFYEEGPTAKVLFDFNPASFEGFSADGVAKLALSRERFRTQRIDGKTALVASRDAAYGMLRMFEALNDSIDLPFEVRVFRELDEARKWLGG